MKVATFKNYSVNPRILQNVLEHGRHLVIFALDRNYRYIFFNQIHAQTMKAIWGCDISVGKSMLDYIGLDEDKIKAKLNFDRALEGQSFQLEEEYGDKEIDRRFYNVIYNPIVEDENIVGLTVMLTDITDKILARKALKAISSTKDRFISLLAHDLITPFNSLQGYSNLLFKNIEHYDRDKIKKFAQTISETTNETLELLNNLLEWSKIQKGQVNFGPKEKNISNLVNEAADSCRSMAASKEIELKIDIPNSIELVVDAEMIKSVFRNLINNAIKFSYQNSEILIFAKEHEGHICFSVKDFGIGMRKETKNSLFQLKEPTSISGTQNEIGFGFGLMLCKDLVEMHHGNINVKSELNKGSTFSFSLPK